MRYAIGIDLGGTNVKVMGVSEEGSVLDQSAKTRFSCPRSIAS